MIIESIDSKKKYDCIIIGAGPAGITVAQKLSTKKKVLLLDSGSIDPGDNLANANLSKFEATGDLVADYYPVHCQRLFGGTSHVWNGWCATLEERSFLNNEWPISYNEIFRYYLEAAKILKVDPEVFLKPEVRLTKDSSVSLRPYHFSPPFRFNNISTVAEIKKNPNIDFLPFSTVLKIDTKSDSLPSLLIGNIADARNPRTYQLKGAKVVVACGGIQNARLLRLSQPENTSIQIGEYLTEHPHVYNCAKIILDAEKYKAARQLYKNSNLEPAICLSSKILKQSGLLSMTYHLQNLESKFENLFGRRREVFFANVTIRGEMEPVASNRVTLSKQNDIFEQGIAQIHLKFDRNSIKASHSLLQRELMRDQIGRISDLYEDFQITGGGHFMCTTRMGTSKDNSVIDNNCKVHGIKGLYVAGSSVFSSPAAANPTLTIVALSLRLANHLGDI